MAFLDNSGDIILDAVLTDTGRFRLARGNGNFRISINKFLDQMRSLKIPYELNYIQEDSSSREFICINNFYTKDF